MGLFGGKSGGADSGQNAARTPRHSSGWKQMNDFLHTDESLRVLDFGPTSAGNINFITALGHSIYMANVLDDVAPADHLPSTDGDQSAPDAVAQFLEDNLNFQGRIFDVVLLWDTLDYLPLPLVQPVADRLCEVISAGGHLLAFFHAGGAPGAIQKQKAVENSPFCRYHLTDSDELQLQRIDVRPVLHTQTSRQVESIFRLYAGTKFYLAKDNLREVIVTR